ncbi:Phenylalanine--tRNA ligase alpha subunit [subsurface metagenome]
MKARVTDAVNMIQAAASMDEVERLRVRFLGRNGEISQWLRSLGQLPADQRRTFGLAANQAKQDVRQALNDRKDQLQASSVKRPMAWLDTTLPGIRSEVGRRHPLMRTVEEIKTILQGMGFRYDDYPEIEEEYYNFDALNTPPWHPSRDMHDSFYTEDGYVLRTHTSAFQVRAMRAMGKPPIRAMTSGRCYRRDQIDATHFPIFHQLDVIAIDRSISFADLKWTLYQMLTALLGPDISLRFRPSYFPFTTPSAEVDVHYRGRWMELLGSGMIRPEVLRNGGLDPGKCQGFAFGMGIDRITMARYNIDDIRLLYENEAAFLVQF